VRDSLTPASASAAVPGAQAGEAHAREAGATLRVVVVDDERPARHFLLGLLRGAPDVEVVGEAADGHEAVALIERTRPDLAFLDLQMPELDGLGVVRALERAIRRDGLPLVAFVTAYDAYAVRAFEVHAVDYLLKPVDGPRLRRTLERAHERLDRADMRESAAAALRRAALEVEAARDEGLEDDAEAAGGDVPLGASPGDPLGGPAGAGRAGAAAPLERIPVRKRDDVVLVPVAHVVAVVADGELLHLATAGGERHTVAYRLKDLEARLPPGQFVRLSRGALARIDAIARISPMPGGTYVVTLANGAQLPVSRLRSRVVREQLLRL
jgi:two-component system LytT family response regulator